MDKRLISADVMIKKRVARALAQEREVQQLQRIYDRINGDLVLREMCEAKVRAADYRQRARE